MKSLGIIISTLMIICDLFFLSYNMLASLPPQVSLAAWAVLSVCSFQGCSMFGKGSWRCQ